jgi:hypothetical protein
VIIRAHDCARLQRREDIEGKLLVYDVEAGGFRGADLSEHFTDFGRHTFVLRRNSRIKELAYIASSKWNGYQQ